MTAVSTYIRVFAVALLALSCAEAASAADMDKMAMPSPSAKQAHGVGVVKQVDLAAGTIVISHEPIKELSWPAMTMMFKVADPSLLKNVSKGNKVQFTLEEQHSATVVTALKVSR
jgi:Cu(I)/Ag(I) efflux system protein CusF